MKTTKAILILAAALLLFYPVSSKADTLHLDVGFVFSGTAPSGGSSPWLTADFSSTTAGTVTLTMKSFFTDIGVNQFVTEWDFNIAPSLESSLGTFTFAHVSGPTASVSVGGNSFKADGDGFYDIMFGFPTSPSGSRFKDTLTSVYTITGDSITASSFDFLSAPGGGTGNFKTGAHVQGIPAGEGSGWIGNVAVPEPGILILLGIAMSAIGAASWRIRKL